MPPILNKNAILSGIIDNFCLVCELKLFEEDAMQHIFELEHKENIKSSHYLDKYKSDCIRKVKKIYYCEFCNLILTTVTKVGFHVDEGSHKNNQQKDTKFELVNGAIVYDKIIKISDNAWNGLIEETCVLCSMEFDEVNEHKTDMTHVLKLIQNDEKIDYDISGVLYRKLDDNTFHCLICNKVSTNKLFNSHTLDTIHVEHYNKSLLTNVPVNNEKTNDVCKQKVESIDVVQVPANIDDNIESTVKIKPEIKTVTEQSNGLDVKLVQNGTEKKVDIVKSAQKETGAKLVDDKSPKTIKNNERYVKSDTSISKPTHSDTNEFKEITKESDAQISEVLGAKDYVVTNQAGEYYCILCDILVHPGHSNHPHHQAILKLHNNRQDNKKTRPAEERKTSKIEDIIEKEKYVLHNIEKEKKVLKKSAISVAEEVFRNTDISKSKKRTPIKDSVVKKNVVKLVDSKAKPTESTEAVKKEKNVKPPQKQPEARKTMTVDEIVSFSEQHNLSYTRNSNNAYCRVCKSGVPITNLSEHVFGAYHKSLIVKHVPKRVPLENFVTALAVFNIMDALIILINDRYFLNIDSFICISEVDKKKVKCHSCDIDLTQSQLQGHIRTNQHVQNVSQSQVLVSKENEFIREVRPDIFHCGYCNAAVEGYSNLELHFKTRQHFESRVAAQWIHEVHHNHVRSRPLEMGIHEFIRYILSN